jgi:hypothetical protein
MATEGNKMRNWDNYTALEQAAVLFSDAHKDAYGSRPRFDTSDWTVEDYEREIGQCAEIIGREEREQDRRAAIMLLEWESQLAAMRALGAADRATAIRWHIQSLGYEGDFNNWDCQEVESALYGTYPIRIWGILLSEVWPTYTMCGVRMDLTDEEKAQLDAQRAREKKNFMTGYRPTWEELGQAA